MKMFFLFVALFILLAFPIITMAADIRTGGDIYIGSDQVIEETFFAMGQNIEILGLIDATAFIAGNSVVISGTITGNLFVTGDNVRITGNIQGDLYIASSSTVIEGQIAGNMYGAGQHVSLTSDSFIARELNIASSYFELHGEIGRNVNMNCGQCIINGIVRGNVHADLTSAHFELGEFAQVEGDLVYTARARDMITQDMPQIQGNVIFDEYQRREGNPFLPYIFKVGALVLVGLIFVTILKEKIFLVSDNIQEKPLKAFLFGLAVLFFTPFIIVLLLVTLIGIPLALIILGTYFIYLYLSYVWFALFIGKWTVQKIQKEKMNVFLALFFGVIITQLVYAIPFIGPLASFAALVLGLGAMVIHNTKVISSFTKKK